MFSTETSCEMQLFHNKTDSSCHLTHSNKTLIWSKMHTLNHWIFAIKPQIQLLAVCPDGASNIILQNAGIISITAGCTLRNSMMTLTSQDTIKTIIHSSFARFGDVTEANKTTTARPTTILKKEDLIEHYAELQKLQEILLPSNTFQLPQVVAPIEHYHIALYAGLVFVMILIRIYLGNKWHKERTSTKRSSPTSPPGETPHQFRININEF